MSAASRTPAPGTVAVITMGRGKARPALWDGAFWRSADERGPIRCVPNVVTSIETPYLFSPTSETLAEESLALHRAWGTASDIGDEGHVNPSSVNYAPTRDSAIKKARVRGEVAVTRLVQDWEPLDCSCGEAWSGHPNPHAITCPLHHSIRPGKGDAQ